MLDRTVLLDFLARQTGVSRPPEAVEIEVRPLRGGLHSPAVAWVAARFSAGGRARSLQFVVKRLEGVTVRESVVYEKLVPAVAAEFSPRLLGVERREHDVCYLFLEPIRPARRWPWANSEEARQVLVRLARLHTASSVAEATAALPAWDYESELQERAAQTVAGLERIARDGPLGALRRGLPAVRRLTAGLPEIRRQLFGYLGLTLIHGDAHPGNVMIRIRRSSASPVLLDWGRARLGSPLEDVSSWLQTLGYWEPEARRRHDTLLGEYLAAAGGPARLTPALRQAYWLAAASTLLAGALDYHRWRATWQSPPGTRGHGDALRAARDCLRVIRRADAFWRAA